MREGRFLRHYYWVNGAAPVALLLSRAAHVDLLSPQWFQVQADGRLRTEIDTELLAIAAELRIAVMPVVLNEDFRPDVGRELLAREQSWDRLIDQLVAAAMAYGLRGLQVDFEELPAEARSSYVRFVARLARRLRARGLSCSVAVGAPLAAEPDEAGRWQEGPHAAAMDYAALGAVVDSMTVMTYDQHTAPDEPGPVAGLPWVEACARSLLAQVPAGRVLLGVPLYYRRWSGKRVSDGPHAEALELAARVGAQVNMDGREREKTYRFVERGVANVVWLQDRETLEQRTALARRLGLMGFSAWRLGHEDPSVFGAQKARSRLSART